MGCIRPCKLRNDQICSILVTFLWNKGVGYRLYRAAEIHANGNKVANWKKHKIFETIFILSSHAVHRKSRDGEIPISSMHEDSNKMFLNTFIYFYSVFLVLIPNFLDSLDFRQDKYILWRSTTAVKSVQLLTKYIKIWQPYVFSAKSVFQS